MIALGGWAVKPRENAGTIAVPRRPPRPRRGAGFGAAAFPGPRRACEELSRPADRRVTQLADHLLIRRVVRRACPSRRWRRRGPGQPGWLGGRPASELARTR